MLYHPQGLYVWDTWYYAFEGRLHCIHLQLLRPGSDRPEAEHGALGHAVSDDLVHWETLPPALFRGEPGSIDDSELWTGCVYQHEGKQYLYYTARSTKENGMVNRIALAVSEDGHHFERCKENPILIPDSRWYCNEFHRLPLHGHGYPIVDGRDLCVVADPEGHGFWGFFAARRMADTLAESSVIGLAHSDDLVHWEQYPPCFTPNRYGCVEVPEVFCLQGRWYMLCLTGNRYGQRGLVDDPRLREATIYAVADKVTGPYTLMENDNLVFGSIFQQGYCGKTIQWKGERVLFFTQGEMKDGCPHGSISFPHALRTTADGRLRAMWYEPLETQYQPLPAPTPLDISDGRYGSRMQFTVQDGRYTMDCPPDWALLPLDSRITNGMIMCDVTLTNARSAGVVVRLQEDVMQGGLCVLLDASRQMVEVTTLRDFPLIECRTWDIRPGATYRLRVVTEGHVVYVYVDDRLAIQCYEPGGRQGYVALMTEGGEASIEHLTIAEHREA